MRIGVPLRSIRRKFLVVGLTAALVTGGASLFLASEAQSRLRSQLVQNTVNIAQQTVFVAAPLVAFDSRVELRKALELLKINPDFAYARISDEKGAPLVSVGDVVPGGCVSGQGLQISESVGLLQVSTPIQDGGKIWGCLELGISRQSTEAGRRADLDHCARGSRPGDAGNAGRGRLSLAIDRQPGGAAGKGSIPRRARRFKHAHRRPGSR